MVNGPLGGAATTGRPFRWAGRDRPATAAPAKGL